MATINLGRVGLVQQGAWQSGVTYQMLDVVKYGSGIYACKVATTTAVPTDATKWELWVEDGAAGPQGAQGPAGPQGAQGSAGSQGLAGAKGTDGTNGVAGAQGPVGPQGPMGPQGPAGTGGTGGGSGGGFIATFSNVDGELIIQHQTYLAPSVVDGDLILTIEDL